MGISISGGEGVIRRLRRTGEKTSQMALRRARRGAKQITQRAKHYAPVDSEDLENAIALTEDKRGTFRRRIEWLIGVNRNSFKRKHLEGYEILMHENYPATYTRNTKASERKNERLRSRLQGRVTLDRGRIVGGKYLERALIDFEEEIAKDIERIMREMVL